jgi:hypothetical protein
MNRLLLVLVAALLWPATAAMAAPLVGFDQPLFLALPGEDFQVQVLLDMDDTTAGLQGAEGGLISMGVRLDFDNTAIRVDDIVLPAALDPQGPDALPALQIIANDEGYALVQASVGLLDPPYAQPLLVSFSLHRLSAEDTMLTLGLGQLLPNESLFITGELAVLDDDLTFGSAQVVVPEPATLGTLGLAGLAALLRRKRRRQRRIS